MSRAPSMEVPPWPGLMEAAFAYGWVHARELEGGASTREVQRAQEALGDQALAFAKNLGWRPPANKGPSEAPPGDQHHACMIAVLKLATIANGPNDRVTRQVEAAAAIKEFAVGLGIAREKLWATRERAQAG
jgi:hypothetical protein